MRVADSFQITHTQAATLIVVVMICTIVSHLSGADLITLKNGGMIEGTIINQDSVSVTIEMDFGRTEMERSEIASISRSVLRSGPEGMPSSASAIQPRWKEIADSLGTVIALRGQAQAWLREQRAQQREIVAREAALNKDDLLFARMKDTLDTRGETMPMFYYNSLIKRLNQLAADIAGRRQALIEMQRRHENRTANPYLTSYLESLARIEVYIQQEKTSLARAGLSPQEQEFFTATADRIAQLERDVETTSVTAVHRGSGIIVTARINGKLDGQYIFDTGAGVVTLSTRFARRLGIVIEGLHESNAILADGKRVKAKNVVLESMEVNGAEVRDVPAMILDKEPSPGVDGLLGMSFLGNFLMVVDNTAGTITLKRFNEK
jgi:clan AA aspartic protease (TIGR02281 family)